jgi:phage replication-related protein YjqB (UPF0714/DUF867 family)
MPRDDELHELRQRTELAQRMGGRADARSRSVLVGGEARDLPAVLAYRMEVTENLAPLS